MTEPKRVQLEDPSTAANAVEDTEEQFWGENFFDDQPIASSFSSSATRLHPFAPPSPPLGAAAAPTLPNQRGPYNIIWPIIRDSDEYAHYQNILKGAKTEGDFQIRTVDGQQRMFAIAKTRRFVLVRSPVIRAEDQGSRDRPTRKKLGGMKIHYPTDYSIRTWNHRIHTVYDPCTEQNGTYLVLAFNPDVEEVID
jgi:hypothetical protein